MTRLQSRITLFLALACALAVPCALGACGKKAATPAQDTSASQNTQAADEEAPAGQATEADSKDDQAKSEAGADTDATDAGADTASADDIRSDEACALLRFYPATYVRAGGADDEPVMLTADDWAQACLPHVDPTSELGATIQSDPASIFTPLGYIEAAVVVNDTHVVSVEPDAVVVEVELEGTQQDWEHTITYTLTYRVSFGDSNLATGVEYLQ